MQLVYIHDIAFWVQTRELFRCSMVNKVSHMTAKSRAHLPQDIFLIGHNKSRDCFLGLYRLDAVWRDDNLDDFVVCRVYGFNCGRLTGKRWHHLRNHGATTEKRHIFYHEAVECGQQGIAKQPDHIAVRASIGASQLKCFLNCKNICFYYFCKKRR